MRNVSFSSGFTTKFFLAFRVLTMICLLILYTPSLGAHWVSWFFHQTENFSAILLKNCSCLTFSRSFACGTPITRLLEHQILSHTSTRLRSFRFSNSFLLRIDKNSLALSPGFQAACCLRRLRSADRPHRCTFISYAAFSRSSSSTWGFFRISLFLIKLLVFLLTKSVFFLYAIESTSNSEKKPKSCLLIPMHVHVGIGFHPPCLLVMMA